MRLLLKGMAATFNAGAAGEMKTVIQFVVTGKQTGNWFLSIENGKCAAARAWLTPPPSRLKLPRRSGWPLRTKMDGQQAFAEGKYSVQGDIALLMPDEEPFRRLRLNRITTGEDLPRWQGRQKGRRPISGGVRQEDALPFIF